MKVVSFASWPSGARGKLTRKEIYRFLRERHEALTQKIKSKVIESAANQKRLAFSFYAPLSQIVIWENFYKRSQRLEKGSGPSDR